MSDTKDDPLERVVVDKDAVNCEQLADPSEGVVAVDGDTGEVVTRPNFGGLDFVANDDDHGGYYIAGHSTGLAIDFLKNAKEMMTINCFQ